MGASQSQGLESESEQPTLNNNTSIKPQQNQESSHANANANSNGQIMGRTANHHPEFAVPKPKPNPNPNPKAMEKTGKTLQLPHNYEAILKDVDSPLDRSSMESLLSHLHAGVFLNQKRKKYWVDKRLNKNCFMLFARDLSITWGEEPRHWHWSYQKETNTSEEFVEVAELVQVCWLEAVGKFDVSKLSPDTLYQVVFKVMLQEQAYGWDVPVNFRLTLPNRHKVERKEDLKSKPRGQWIDIPFGEFTTSSENVGELEIYFYEYDAGVWRRGLVIKGFAILPKN